MHRYAFQVFALSALVSFSETPGREEVVGVLRDTTIASGLLIGTYERPDGSIRNDARSARTVVDDEAEGASVPGALPLTAPSY